MNDNTQATCNATKNSTTVEFDLVTVDRDAVTGSLRTVQDPQTVFYESSTYDFIGEIAVLAGGACHGVRIGVIDDSSDEPLIEFSGELPPTVRGRMRRAFAHWERLKRGGLLWDSAWAVLHKTRNGYGPRFEIKSLGALVDLLAARRVVVGGAA